MEEKVRESLTSLNAYLSAIGAPYAIELVDPRSIRLLDKNARYMPHEMFQALVNNVKRDQSLGSLPLCWRQLDGSLLVLSGNHRVQAAVSASLAFVLVLVISRALTREEVVAIQLSHNAIEGKDDPVILKQLWDEIQSIDMKLYAGLDSEVIKDIEKLKFTTISDAAPDYKQIVFMFLPEEVDDLKALLSDADAIFSGDETYVIARSHYSQVFELIVEIKEKYKIVNHPTAFMKVVELARAQLEVEGKKDASAVNA